MRANFFFSGVSASSVKNLPSTGRNSGLWMSGLARNTTKWFREEDKEGALLVLNLLRPLQYESIALSRAF